MRAHAEARLVLKAAEDCGFIDGVMRKQYELIPYADELRAISPHALSTPEYIDQLSERPRWALEKRLAKIGSLSLTLPLNYVGRVVDAVREGKICDLVRTERGASTCCAKNCARASAISSICDPGNEDSIRSRPVFRTKRLER